MPPRALLVPQPQPPARLLLVQTLRRHGTLTDDDTAVAGEVDSEPSRSCTSAPQRLRAASFYGTVPNGRFGDAVAGLGDVDGDGVPDYAVGVSAFKVDFWSNGQLLVISGRG